jgi:hypothetical protein
MPHKASNIDPGRRVSLLLKGPYGFGKTLAASSFCLEGPIHISYWDKQDIIELDHYYRSILKRPELLSRIEYDVFNSHNANEYLNFYMEQVKSGGRYSAYITDSVTNMTSGAVNWSLGFRQEGKGKSKDKDKIMPDFDEYKIETSLVTQALDLCKALSAHIIWTCHPVPSIRIEGSGSSMKVTKTNPIVTYGNKVAGIVPGNFSEIYHFSRRSDWDQSKAKLTTKYLVNTVGTNEDDFAKSNLGLNCEMDITGRLFYEVWKEQVLKLKETINELTNQQPVSTNPITAHLSKQIEQTIPSDKQEKVWNPEKGKYV